MWKVIDVLYECNIGYPNGGVLPVASSILQIEHQLLEWQATLGPLSGLVTPDELRNDDDVSPERRFRVILTLRYHNVRILAHRRMLDLYLASVERGQVYDAEDSMLKQVGQRSKGICFQSASDLISIVHTLLHSHEPKKGLLGAWWFTLYYSAYPLIFFFSFFLFLPFFLFLWRAPRETRAGEPLTAWAPQRSTPPSPLSPCCSATPRPGRRRRTRPPSPRRGR